MATERCAGQLSTFSTANHTHSPGAQPGRYRHELPLELRIIPHDPRSPKRTWVKFRPQRARHASPPVLGAMTSGYCARSCWKVASGMPVLICSTASATFVTVTTESAG